jgi:hypothetical protein
MALGFRVKKTIRILILASLVMGLGCMVAGNLSLASHCGSSQSLRSCCHSYLAPHIGSIPILILASYVVRIAGAFCLPGFLPVIFHPPRSSR